MSEDISSALRLVTAPAEEPVSLEQAKAFLRIEHTADDETITTAIMAARQFAEQYLRVALIGQSWEYSIGNPGYRAIALPLGPATAIDMVTTTNAAGTATTVNPANYRLSIDGYALIFANVPSTEKLTVRFDAGLAETAADVPATIVQGLLHHIAVLVENRDGILSLPMQSAVCYQPFRRIAV